ncbi:phosphatidylinositol-glycan biosynthesis class F-like protein [Arabidopsis thaliana]|uniref:Phosphatidylinositol-glycan biosynthesis class F-like protein n=1 Tax=Arabidopsis thaliana TaxID=3702 RepID=A0A1P8APH0_ARATH|nr:phosphatidylinositol-glycan biosynthesis class F-like protein [Arabidopsis thaliana]ANM58544.1 phosphatidylinositol-glycan biosynthesis class F-like protein [Arabidopsis thaliana]|eukprot:NP_001320969.1 phosphatidylinositol-glycan biosynthesis class F-like protein [Arabidopsis thaliana]
MKEAKEKKNPEISVSITISTWGAFAVYVITGLFLIFGFHVVRNKYSVDLISDPTLTLRLLWIIEFPIVVIIYSLFRRNPEKCSYFRAVGRSLVGLIAATAVLGASWIDWHRIFASLKPIGIIEHMLLVPAYGAIIGGWFGAWPMPLDWERPWQEWPICVCYGAIGGYIGGQMVSLLTLLSEHKNLKLA